MHPRVALITGAASGIGRALAVRLSREDYVVAGLDFHESGLISLAQELQGKPFVWEQADVANPSQVQEAIRKLEHKAGPIDLLIANAGIGLETSALHFRPDDFAKVIGVNLLGVSNCIGAVLPGMVERKQGHIVGISSITSFRGMPRLLGYCASKSGLNSLLEGIRTELTPLGIHVTTICPGWIRTPMTDPIQGKLENLLEPNQAAEEIWKAIRRKKFFHAFPTIMVWKMRLLSWLPLSIQDWYLRGLSSQMMRKKEKEKD